MIALNAATTLFLSLFSKDPRPMIDYRAPHANRGTPARPRKNRKAHEKHIRKALFNGWRA